MGGVAADGADAVLMFIVILLNGRPHLAVALCGPDHRIVDTEASSNARETLNGRQCS